MKTQYGPVLGLVLILLLIGAGPQPLASTPAPPATGPPSDVYLPVITHGEESQTTATPAGTTTPSPTPTATSTATSTVTSTVTATPSPTPTTPLGGLSLALTVHNPDGAAHTREPVTSGAPLPRSLALTDTKALRLVDGSGQPVPAQFTALARWGGPPDASAQPIRWLLLDFQADLAPGADGHYRLILGDRPASPPPLTVTETITQVLVDVGSTQLAVSKLDGSLDGPHLAAPLRARAVLAGEIPVTVTAPVSVAVDLRGPLRAAVTVRGSYWDGSGQARLDGTTRYWFYAGQPRVRIFHTVENNSLCPVEESGQIRCYDIGSGGSVQVQDLSLGLATDLGTGLGFAALGESAVITGSLTGPPLLYQDSSGTEHWDRYPTLRDWEGTPLDARPRMQAHVRFRGYRTTLGPAQIDEGNQAQGRLTLTGGRGGWSLAVRDFWQNFPKALRAWPDGRMEAGLFPHEFGPAGYAFTLRAGEHKSHELWLTYTPPGRVSVQTGAAQPLFASAPLTWYVESGAFGLTAMPNRTDWPDHEQYIHDQLDTAAAYEEWMDWFPNLPTAITDRDFYGIFDYGDIPIDYEGYRIAPLNLKYDMNLGMWLQWIRTGDPRWFRLAEAGARHFADVDILHNLHSPRHWADGIAFGHSYHDEDAFRNPHRNYGGNHPDTAFGLPGLLLAYYLTGYDKALAGAVEMADCIEYRLHNDSHLCSYFPDCNGEGYALGEGLYADGGRPAANSLMIATETYRATGKADYLAVADALVDWARASKQPYMVGPIPGDERYLKPWMLNLYLRSLAAYLEMRAEFGLPDTIHAGESYLAYADWLRTHALLDLTPLDTGPRAAYPYQWWFDGRVDVPGEDNDNHDPSVNNWLLLGADAQAYAHRLSGDANALEQAARLFRAGSRDPWYEGDANTYSSAKETANSIVFGNTFLHVWAQTRPGE